MKEYEFMREFSNTSKYCFRYKTSRQIETTVPASSPSVSSSTSAVRHKTPSKVIDDYFEFMDLGRQLNVISRNYVTLSNVLVAVFDDLDSF